MRAVGNQPCYPLVNCKIRDLVAHPFHPRLEKDTRKALVGRAQLGISQPTPKMDQEKKSVSFRFSSPRHRLSFLASSAKSSRNSSRQTLSLWIARGSITNGRAEGNDQDGTSQRKFLTRLAFADAPNRPSRHTH